jgi:hypothetical protein
MGIPRAFIIEERSQCAAPTFHAPFRWSASTPYHTASLDYMASLALFPRRC